MGADAAGACLGIGGDVGAAVGNNASEEGDSDDGCRVTAAAKERGAVVPREVCGAKWLA